MMARPRRVASSLPPVLVALVLVRALPATEIPKGAHVLLRMVNSVSTRTARAGDQVYMRTASPIVASDRIVVPVNSYVQATVTSAKRGGRVSGKAELGLRLDTLTLPGGKTYHFSAVVDSVDSQGSSQVAMKEEGAVRQGPEHAQDAGRILVTAGTGAALGGIVDRSVRGAAIGGGAGAAAGLVGVMLTRGQDVQLRAGATLDVVLDRPLLVE
jgi:hypothetical protein